MATNFPTSLDTLTNPTATDTLDSPPHDTQHADANDAIEALEAKVGIDSSAVTTSLDYRVGQLELGGGSMTTSSTAPSSPSDGDMWYDTDDGRTYVYYDDGTSAQWVEFGAPAVAHGKILQVVSTFVDTTFSTSSTSFVDVTGHTATITPSSATSKVYVVYTSALGHTTAAAIRAMNLLRDGTNIAQPASGSIKATMNAYDASGGTLFHVVFNYLDSPATTSAVVYKLQVKTDGGTVYVGSDGYNQTVPSVLTLMEISA